MTTSSLRDSLCVFLSDDDGATAIEYGLIAALVALVIVSGVTLLSGKMIGMYGVIEAAMP